MKVLIIITLLMSIEFTYAQLPPVQSGVYPWANHTVKKSPDRETRKILEGSSSHFEYLEIHATSQMPGAEPGAAHANEDIEEVIIVKEGLMKVKIEGESQILGAEGVILLMPQKMHAIENVGDSQLTYFVMRYRSKKTMNLERGETDGGSLVLNADSLKYIPGPDGKKGGKAYFDRKTAMCERFEMHITQLNKKGLSHKPHAHLESDILLILAGNTEMEIDGKKYQASTGDFYLAGSQLLHGISNVTEDTCSYFAFKWF